MHEHPDKEDIVKAWEEPTTEEAVTVTEKL